MVTRQLLTGASALAILATSTTAFAQANTRSITSGGGTGNVTNECDQAGATNSACTINQSGNNNRSFVTQTGDGQRANSQQNGNRNNSDITQSDAGNSATVTQGSIVNADTAGTGVAGAAPSLNSSTVTQSGQSNSASITQSNQNTVLSTTTGGVTTDIVNNVSTVTQRSNVAPAGSTATIIGNTAVVSQDQRSNLAGSSSTIDQTGTNNTVTLSQFGSANSSTVTQGTAAAGAAAAIVSVGNVVSVSQNGLRTSSTVVQQAAAGAAAGTTVDNNRVTVQLGNGGGGGTAANSGFTDVGNSSSVTQNSSGNIANVFVFDGGTTGGTTNINRSTVTQGNAGRAASAAGVTPGNPAATPVTLTDAEAGQTRNEVFVSLARGSQQSSSITQNGVGNFADVTITSGVAGNDPGSGAGDPTTGRSGGNTSTITQTGRGAVALVNTQAQAGTSAQGLGNQVTIDQQSAIAFANRGAARGPSSTPASSSRVAIGEPGAGEAAGANGQVVQTYQFGRFGTMSLTQRDGPAGANGTTVASQGRARANLSQAGELFTMTVIQNGDNLGEVTQGLGGGSLTSTARGTVSLTQTDAGQTTTTTAAGPGDPFGNPGGGTTGSARAFNVASLTQYGTDNAITAEQNAVNGFVTVFQRTGTASSTVQLEQGTGRSVQFSQTDPLVPTSGTGTSTGVAGGPALTSPALGGTAGTSSAATGSNPIGPQSGAAAISSTANLTQGGRNNQARVFQDSTRSFLNIEQLGSANVPAGSAAGATVDPNRITVAQQGTNNFGTIRQAATVGRSVGTAATTAPQSGNSAADNTAANNGTAADEFFFGGGPRSAEAQLLQNGVSNTAEIDQRGLGQFARIEQQGSSNNADIDQREGATNATAVIRQAGSGNSYFIVQTQPGQFINVSQTGTNNSAIDITTRGGSQSGFTPQ